MIYRLVINKSSRPKHAVKEKNHFVKWFLAFTIDDSAELTTYLITAYSFHK
jgi:hypothetical protein